MKGIQMCDMHNMMNDFRHLVIADLRMIEKFEISQIRGSFSIQDDAQSINKHLQHLDQNAIKNEEKYKTQPIRRIVFVNDDPKKIESEQNLITQLIESLKMKHYKLYYLKSSIEEFIQKYPFYELSKQILTNYDQVEEAQIKVLFSYSQFPQLLIDDIYLGSNFNANSKKQLTALGINTIIDFKVYDGESKIPEKQNYIHYPIEIEQLIDFTHFTETVQQLTKPILFCCPDGQSITNIMAIGYLMTIKKQNFNLASLKVFQIRGNTQVNKQLYSQLLTYKP